MAAFASRTSGYQVGVVLLILMTGVFFLGYVSPFWYESGELYFSGLWMECPFETECSMITFNRISPSFGWYHAVRTLESLCLIGLLAACVYAVVTNCCRSVPGHRTRTLEILSALSGVIGFIGCMVYVGMSKSRTPGWAFYMSVFGSAHCVVSAIIIAVCNKPLPSNAHEGVTMETVSSGRVQVYTSTGGSHGQAQAQSYGNSQSMGSPTSYNNSQSPSGPPSYGDSQFPSGPQPYGNSQSLGGPPSYGNSQSRGGPQSYDNSQSRGGPQSYDNSQFFGGPHDPFYGDPPSYSGPLLKQ